MNCISELTDTSAPLPPEVVKAFRDIGYEVKTEDDREWVNWNLDDWEIRKVCKKLREP